MFHITDGRGIERRVNLLYIPFTDYPVCLYRGTSGRTGYFERPVSGRDNIVVALEPRHPHKVIVGKSMIRDVDRQVSH